jgi:hypothetical protein
MPVASAARWLAAHFIAEPTWRILGFDLFRSPAAPAAGKSVAGEEAVFTFSTAGATATARDSDGGFVVLAGSTARRQGTETFPLGYQALRDQLVQDGHLVDGPSPELYRFAADVQFASPSAAASIVAARSASGPREWKAKGSGQPLSIGVEYWAPTHI